MNTYLGKYGYTIFKSELSDTNLQIKHELTMKPYQSWQNEASSSVQYPIYESSSRLYIPRYYGIDQFGPVENNIHQGLPIDLEFKGNLFEYQNRIVSKFTDFIGESGGGLLDVEPGKGKTVMALNIISKIKRKTLVVVHKSFLLNQWKERIAQFLPEARVGQIQGQILDVDDKDIVIGMLQTLSTKDLDETITKQFGLCVFDECHHLSAEYFVMS